MMKGVNLNSWDLVKLHKISPWAMVSIFMVTAMIFVSFSSSSFLYNGFWIGNQELDVDNRIVLKGPDKPPVFAYWILGTGGENAKIMRLLRAIYHPRNHYLVHLDAGATIIDRTKLARSIHNENIFKTFQNVDVVGKSYAVDRAGPSLVSATLHGAAVLLKISRDWDWFITLSSSDYPLVTQDDILDVFTPLPRDLNFIDHTSDIGWKEFARFDKIIVDPSLYMEKNTPFILATETRKTPDAFKIFTGSPWVILSRPFMEHCVHSWDNLPRKLLMYFTNVAYSAESYFQTVICNTPEFHNTTVNHDLRFVLWDDPPKLQSLALNNSHYKWMMKSGKAFGRWFLEDDPVLEKLDTRILRRTANGVTPGGWCTSSPVKNRKRIKDEEEEERDLLCSSWSNINLVKPTAHGKQLKKLILKLVSEERMYSNQCK